MCRVVSSRGEAFPPAERILAFPAGETLTPPSLPPSVSPFPSLSLSQVVERRWRAAGRGRREGFTLVTPAASPFTAGRECSCYSVLLSFLSMLLYRANHVRDPGLIFMCIIVVLPLPIYLCIPLFLLVCSPACLAISLPVYLPVFLLDCRLPNIIESWSFAKRLK